MDPFFRLVWFREGSSSNFRGAFPTRHAYGLGDISFLWFLKALFFFRAVPLECLGRRLGPMVGAGVSSEAAGANEIEGEVEGYL